MKAVVKVLDAKSLQGVCPRWHQQSGSLYWLDVTGQCLNAWQTENDRTQTLQLPESSGCFSFCSPNSRYPTGIVTASHCGFFLIDSFRSGIISPFHLHDDCLLEHSVVDGRCDAAGRFWLGSACTSGNKAGAGLYSLNAALQLEQKTGSLMATNGIAFSPDSSTIYYADAPEHVIYACEYNLEQGELSNRRVFHRFPFGKGMPGGAAVDVEGGYWVAMFAGSKLVRLSPGGLVLEEIALPVKYPTMMTFGGDNNTTLFIASSRQSCSEKELEQYPESGGIFAVEAGISGMTEYTFAA